MLKPGIKIFDSPGQLAAAFAYEFAARVKFYSDKKGIVNVALSGGNTPELFFKVLAEDFGEAIKWGKVNFYWADERCVLPDNPESNFGMTKQNLLNHISIPPQNIHRIKGEDEPRKEAARYSEEILRNVNPANGLPEFDIILLGVGEDGHTASIFPTVIQLINSENICEVSAHPVSLQKRITLTGRVINNAAYIAFLVSGDGKAEVVSDIIDKTQEAEKYPAAKINPANGELEWYLDKDAAKLIQDYGL